MLAKLGAQGAQVSPKLSVPKFISDRFVEYIGRMQETKIGRKRRKQRKVGENEEEGAGNRNKGRPGRRNERKE